MREAYSQSAPADAPEDLCGGPGEPDPTIPDGVIDDADLSCVRADLGHGVGGLYTDNPPVGPTNVARPDKTFSLHGLTLDHATGLVFARARYYHPSLGRWMLRDPKSYVDGGSLYEAFGSNPARFTDPMGTDAGFNPMTQGLFGASPEEVRRVAAAAAAAGAAQMYGATPAEAQKAAESVLHPKYYLVRPADAAYEVKRFALALLGGDADTAYLREIDYRLETELTHLGGGLLLLGVTFSPGQDSALHLFGADSRGQFGPRERLELGVLGPLQGATYAIEGAVDVGVDLGNLALDVSLIRPIAQNVNHELDLVIPEVRFAEDVFLPTSPRTAAASRRLGGESIIFLATSGFGKLRGFGRGDDLAAKSGLPIKGFRGSKGSNPFHALDRAIERGVSPKVILNTVENPTVRLPQGGGRTLYLTKEAAVVLDSSGQAVTTWSGAQHTAKTLELLQSAAQ